ncbi:Uncharacterised protein [Shigella sonnei]|nr:Uncharacterised protein [Shigella sonnei]
MAGRQRLINIARRHGVNNIGSLNLIIRKDSQHAACAAVIGGDDGITPRCWVINSAEINIVQHRQIRGAGINIAGRIKQETAARRAGFPLRAEHIFPGSMLYHLH